MKQLQYFISLFTKITTGTVIVCAVILKLLGVEQWTSDILWQIPLCGAATTLISMIVLPDRDFSRRVWVVRYCIHFVLVSACILAAGAAFGWYDPTPLGCLYMMGSIAVVYAFAVATTYLSSRHSAQELNSALEEHRRRRDQ